MSKIVTTTFGREYTRTFRESIRREWVIANGIGGYAGSSLIGANTRKHHGLLIASLHAPTDRKVILNRIQETVVVNDMEVSLSSVQRKGQRYEEGYLYQTGFSFDAIPTFSYFYKGLSVKKTVALEWEKNTVAVCYEISNQGEDCVLSFTPVFNYRDHNAGSRKSDLKFDTFNTPDCIILEPKKSEELIRFYTSHGVIVPNDIEDTYDEAIELQTEIDTGMSSKDTGYSPYNIELGIGYGERKTVSFICTIEADFERNALVTIKKARKRAEDIITAAGFKDDFLKRLVVNGDNFIVKRTSTEGKTVLAGLPWFTDWGRDTMIAFTGLTLETNRFEDAKSILETFTRYEKNGILPNMFPDENTEPLYNTVDASLWYFYCVWQYLKYVNTKEAFDFIEKDVYPCLKRVQKAYEKGTDFSIFMDKDGLIHAGSDLDQVTWMDVRANGYVVTPRHGKPVEINALWYNALKIMAELADKFKDYEYRDKLLSLSERVKESFNKRFFNDRLNCLYDVVDETGRDGVTIADNDAIRPNQIWAVSLPFTMLDRKREEAVVKTVLEKLYIDFGLRTLPQDDPDYHGRYEGKLSDRDMAYHQGTAWAFPLGAFISAFLKVNDYSAPAKEYALSLMEPMKNHLNDGCIGGIAEVFDADPPFISHGCYTQAWSVGEIIRAYNELVKL